MAAPETQNWRCLENDMPPGPGKLRVRGDVKISDSNQTPQLAEGKPRGINPKILLLDLTITTPKAGQATSEWKQVEFRKKFDENQFSEVDIRWQGQVIQKLKVEHAS